MISQKRVERSSTDLVPGDLGLHADAQMYREFYASGGDLNGGDLMLRVLLVEDDETNREVALLLLHHLGYQVDVAGNGIEALAAICLSEYDVILMDVQMPEMDGLEATRRIRADQSLSFQPAIIAMTGSIATDYQAICLDAGMDDYLPKPVRKDALAAMLTNWSHHRQDLPDLETLKSTTVPVVSVDYVQNDAIFDFEVLDNLIASLELSDIEGPKIRKELLQDFVNDSDNRLEAIVEADRADSAEALASVAHAIKSASATLGLLCLSRVASDIEASYLIAAEVFDVHFEATILIAAYRQAIDALRLVLEVEADSDT